MAQGDDPKVFQMGLVVLSRPMCHFDRQALPREFVDEREDAEHLAVGAMILEEVIGPDAIGALGSDRHGVPSAATPPTATTRPGQVQAQCLPQAVDPLVLDGPALAAEHRPSPSIAVTGMPLGQVPQPLTDVLVPARAPAVSQAGPADVEQSAGAPLGDPPPTSACRRMWTICGSLNRLLRIESAPLTGRILPFPVVQFSGSRSCTFVRS
jgi:hypothetical protein